MARQQSENKSAKMLYRPVGLASSILGGVLASVIFKQLWSRIAPGDHPSPPKALESQYSLKQVLIAATV